MIEAYKVAVSLVMDSNVGRETGALIQQMRMLERAISNVQMGVNQLTAGMRGLSRVGRSAADSWTAAASAMERAARAAERAGRAMPGGPGGFGGGGTAPRPRRGGAAPAARGLLAWSGSTPARVGYDGAGRPLLGWDGPGLYGPPYGPGVPGGGYVPGGRALQGPGYSMPLFAGAAGGAVAAWSGGGRPPTTRPPGGLPAPWSSAPRGPIPLNFQPRRLPKSPSGHDFALAALGYGMVGRGLTGFVGDVISAGMKPGEIEARLIATGYYTPAQAAAVFERAKREAPKVPGMTITGAMTAEADLFSVTHSRKEARQLTPGLLRTAVVLATYGKTDLLPELFNLAKSAELKGVVGQGPEATASFLKLAESVMIASGGRISPEKMFAFLKSSGASGGLMSDRDFGALIPVLMSMDAQRAGTGLRGVFQQFITGRMSTATGNILAQMGLADPEKLQKYGIGMYQATPGWLKGGKVLDQGKYAEWIVHYLLPAVHRFNLAKYHADNPELTLKTVSQVASRIPGANFLTDFVRLLPQSERYDEATRRAGRSDAFGAVVAHNPMLQVAALQAGWTNFLTVLANSQVMDAATTTLNDLTGGLNALSDWADHHKGTAAALVGVAGGLGALSLAVAAIAGVLWVAGPMFRVGKWGLARAGIGTGAPAAEAAGAGLVAGLLGKVAWPLAIGAVLWNQDPFGLNDVTPADVWHRITGGGPSVAPPAASGQIHLHGDVNLDGYRVGSVVAGQHADQLSRPPAGPTGPDSRLTIPIPGLGGL